MQTANRDIADREHLVRLIMWTAAQMLKCHCNKAVNADKRGKNNTHAH